MVKKRNNSTVANAELKEITLDALIEQFREWNFKAPKSVSELRCSPEYYRALMMCFDSLGSFYDLLGIVKEKPTQVDGFSGIKVIVDKNMKPNEWKFY